MHVTKMIYPQAMFFHISRLSCQSEDMHDGFWCNNAVLWRGWPFYLSPTQCWLPRSRLVSCNDDVSTLTYYCRVLVIFLSLGGLLSRLVLVLVCFTYHGTLKWVIHITSSLEARFRVDSKCNLDRALVRTYYVSSLCRGTGAFAMSSSLWTCKAHTSILTMTGLIISCRFACGEIHINFRTW